MYTMLKLVGPDPNSVAFEYSSVAVLVANLGTPQDEDGEKEDKEEEKKEEQSEETRKRKSSLPAFVSCPATGDARIP